MEPNKNAPSVLETLSPVQRTVDLATDIDVPDLIEAAQPSTSVVDFVADDFKDHQQPAQEGPQIARYREFPQQAAQGQPQTAEDAEYDAAFNELVQERMMLKRAAQVSTSLANEFLSKHKGDFVPNPSNASLLAETMRTHNMPMTLENMDAALEAIRFALDSRPANQFTRAELEASQQIVWPMPPQEMLQVAPRGSQPSQPSSQPPCASCGKPFEAHANGECPTVQPAVKPVSTGLPDRPMPIVAQPDTSDPALMSRLATMPLEQARTEMLRLMRSRALATNDPLALAEQSALEQQRRYRPSQF